ncbi:hypothetical protein DACRYDRAFT_21347 [Dacryopinax primogenitus]|uniref:Uncharacterized protein n=1 Tax=Dacryopinax primogenitus (strain DJM 731) TaxID=1858805 RepID=M5G442_DACPD|nr:uncharacterized protein DACRYDRAFT_21347 [Dacryopinax primogenitus]EJU02980.1 hypothetical protein DACRYDRAFT_21347 [Dacryopinax primogenitus]
MAHPHPQTKGTTSGPHGLGEAGSANHLYIFITPCPTTDEPCTLSLSLPSYPVNRRPGSPTLTTRDPLL